MSTILPLPPTLAQRIGALGRRVRRLGVLRGTGLVLTFLTLGAAAAFLADHYFHLPPLVRQGLFSAWAGLGAVALLAAILVPLCRRLDRAALAALVEEKYPSLGERLTTSVELTSHSSEGHGSAALLDLLVRDTEQRARPFNFRRAMPVQAAAITLLAAALAAIAVLLPVLAFPSEAAALAQRFFQPWYVPAEPPPFAISIAPGDAFAACGRSLRLTASLQPRDDKVVLPTAVTLILTDAAGKESRQDLESARDGSFATELRVGGDFRYRVEAGGQTSESFAVTAVTPVELAAESPIITIRPPAYAAKHIDTETFHGLVDLAALQHSEILFDFRFTRPAVAARLEWTTQEVKETKDANRAVPTTVSHDLKLQDSGQAATFTLPALVPGSFRLILLAEHGITTERDGGALAVRPDMPPEFLKVLGKEDLSAVLPYERLPVEVHLSDDVAVAEAALEFRVNGGPAEEMPLELAETGNNRSTAKAIFRLAGKVKEEDEVSFRLRARDNLPKEFQGPHTVYYPPDRWLRLKVAKTSQPLKPQEIASQQDEINRRLDAIRADLLSEKRGVYRTQQESTGQPELAREQAGQVKQLQKDNDANQKALHELAQLAGNNPALEPVANRADEVARTQMQQTREALDRAGRRQANPETRKRDFKSADKLLEMAVRKLDDLKRINDKLAQERKDQARLEELAEREKHLAERAAELAAKHPARDPEAKDTADKLRQEQAEVAAELEKLTQRSAPLRQALEEDRADRARQAAKKARELAQAQRDLAEATHDTDRRRAEERLGDLARRQKELTDEAARLAEQTRMAARSAGAQPFQPNDQEQALENLKRGDAADAAKRQERAVQELTRLANALEAAAQVSRDPRYAARQLAALQGVVRQAAEEEMKQQEADQPLAERLKPLKEEQEAIRRAAERLSVPPRNSQAVLERKNAMQKAAEAAKALDKTDGKRTLERMDQARQALEHLADRLPPLLDRIAQGREEASRLRKEQAAIAKAVEQISKDDPDAARKRAEAARREADVAQALKKMDTPNQEERKQRVQAAVDRARTDLNKGSPENQANSQQEAQRQLARLEKALAGQTPSDQAARDLARQQRDLARAATDPKATAQEKLDMRRQQRQVAEQTQALPATEASEAQQAAAEATRRAAEASRDDPTHPEAQQAMQEAARKLEDLDRQLNGPRPEPQVEQPKGLPTPQQVEQPRDLARRQEQLRMDVLRAQARAQNQNRPRTQDNPLGELSRQQQEVARAATDLERDTTRSQGENTPATGQAKQASQATQQAARALEAGALESAQKAGGKAADNLHQLSKQSGAAGAQAQQLAQRQEDLNRQMAELARKPNASAAQQQARQGELAKQAGELAQDLNQAAGEMSRSGAAQQAEQQAAQQAKQAQQNMENAQQQGQRGASAQMQQSQEDAAAALDKAAEKAEQAAQALQPGGGKQGNQGNQGAGKEPGSAKGKGNDQQGGETPSAGQAVKQAQGQMSQAQGQLALGQNARAQGSMEQAAESLQMAIKALAKGGQQPGQPGQPDQSNTTGTTGITPGGLPDLSPYGVEKGKFVGKTWGELPGELRTRIIQDMKAKYGDDYARMIKLYFEQIADTRKK
jgi:hypothetical protein